VRSNLELDFLAKLRHFMKILARSSKNRDKQFGSEQKAQKLFIIYRAELATRDCLTVLTVFAVYGPNTTPRL